MAVKATAARPTQLSEEYVQDSSDEEDDTRENVGSRRAIESEDSEGEDLAEASKPDEADASPDQEEDAGSESSDASHNSSSSLEADQDDSEAGKSDNGSNASRKRSREPEHSSITSRPSKRQKSSNGTAPIRIPSRPFKPPAGFEPLVLDASDYASDAADVLSDLSGKQVWYISAPSSVKINLIKQIDISAALKGDPIFTENNVSYTMQPVISATDTLLLPDDSNRAYTASKTQISRAFQLQAIEKSAMNTNTASDQPNGLGREDLVFTAQTSGQLIPPRQQPAGLKTHYVPYGVIDGDKTTTSARISPRPSGLTNGKPPSTNINRTPSKPSNTGLAMAIDSMDVDENLSTNETSLDAPRKPAEPSPAKSSVSGTPGEKRRKKKRSKLVDTPGV